MWRHSRLLLTMEPRPQMTWWGETCKPEEPVHQKMLEDGCFFICLCPWAAVPQCTFSLAFSGIVAECESSPFCLLSLELRIVCFVLYFTLVGSLATAPSSSGLFQRHLLVTTPTVIVIGHFVLIQTWPLLRRPSWSLGKVWCHKKSLRVQNPEPKMILLFCFGCL